MSWDVIVEVVLEHDYYAPKAAPVTVQPSDPSAFARAGLLWRRSGAIWMVLAEDGATDLPENVLVDVVAQTNEVISVTEGADWVHVPLVRLLAGMDTAELTADQMSEVRQPPERKLLAQLDIGLLPGSRRKVTARFPAIASHWAYHVIGPHNDDVTIEDTEGEVLFDALGAVPLPEGVTAQVIRSRHSLPARARPGQRFSLSRPGPFGPRTLIPVLPAPEPRFVTVPGPDGAGAIIQSDIYVSIF